MAITSTLHQRLKEHSIHHGNKVVVKDVHREWTWNALMHEAHLFATAILDVASEQTIMPIIVDRTGTSVAAMLGCILVGKCFAPLSETLPIERIESCVRKTASPYCVDATGGFLLNQSFTYQVIVKSNNPSATLPEIKDEPNRLLYVLFTSGSTGEPKGVMVNSGNIENTMLWSEDMITWDQHDVMGCASLFSFDIAMFDFFTMIYYNVCMAIFSNTKDFHTVLNEINRFRVSSIFSVPQFFSSLLHADIEQVKTACASLLRILSGGDFFNPVHLLVWYQSFPQISIYNVWGPTETSIVNTMHRVVEQDIPSLEQGQLPPVGKQHERMPFVLLNESRETIVDQPFVQGEIVMLGDCVTQGYLSDITLTASKYGMFAGSPCFYTEDLAYVDGEGNVYMAGRLGSMVKISGFRVDLNEIDIVASAYENIHTVCSIVVGKQQHDKQLHLVCTLQNVSKELDIYAFKSYLRSRFPAYMVPKRIHVLPSMPLNANAKVDRKKLIELFSNNEFN